MFRDYTLQTTWGRALKALAGGAVVGAVILAAFMAFDLYRDFGAYIFHNNAVYSFITGFAIAIAIWGLGVLLFGAPIWFALHKLGYRTWSIALIVGFAVPFIVFLLANTNFLSGTRDWPTHLNDAKYFGADPRWHGANLTALGWRIAAYMSAIFGAIGTLVALTIWRIAYRRPPPC